MPTVTVLTAERMLEIEANSVVDGSIVNGNLILTKHDGSTIDAGPITNQVYNKVIAADPDSIIVGDITRDVNGAATAAGVEWPDGTLGDYTATVVSVDFPGLVDAYTVTKGTITYTQPQVTRNADGAIINRPAIVVS